MSEDKIIGYTFYVDSMSNDWYGIRTADIEDAPDELLIGMIKDAIIELERRGRKNASNKG